MIKATMLHPHSTVYRMWEAVVVIAVLIAVFLHPYAASFVTEEHAGKISFRMDRSM